MLTELWESLGPAFAFLTGLTGLVFGALGTYFAFRSHRFSLQAQERPSVSFSLFGVENCDEFVIGIPLREGRFSEVQVPLLIQNRGSRTADDLEVHCRINKSLLYGGNIEKAEGSRVRSIRLGKYFATITLAFEQVNPNVASVEILPIAFRSETYLRTTTTVASRRLDLHLHFAAELHVILSYRDNPPEAKRFLLRVVNTSDRTLKEWFQDFNQLCEKNWSKLSFMKKLLRLLRSKDNLGQRRIQVIIPKGDATSRDDLPIDVYEYDQMSNLPGFENERGAVVLGLN